MFRNIIPHEAGFFDLFDQHAALVVRCAQSLLSVTSDGFMAHAAAEQIAALEDKADTVTHNTVELLHKTFITPFDRDEIFSLISTLDDVVDNVDAAADCLILYKIKTLTPASKDLAEIILTASKELQEAIRGLRNLQNSESIRQRCMTIYKLEKDADNVVRNAIGQLFDEEPDVRNIIKWKEIYEHLEDAVDRIEDVANIIEGVILENV